MLLGLGKGPRSSESGRRAWNSGFLVGFRVKNLKIRAPGRDPGRAPGLPPGRKTRVEISGPLPSPRTLKIHTNVFSRYVFFSKTILMIFLIL